MTCFVKKDESRRLDRSSTAVLKWNFQAQFWVKANGALKDPDCEILIAFFDSENSFATLVDPPERIATTRERVVGHTLSIIDCGLDIRAVVGATIDLDLQPKRVDEAQWLVVGVEK